ncbi:MAG: DNA cytosine methyltransferase, partial [Treponema sp.]|nr:DNA cytosine methyltransferase [Treponema sp.]
SKEDFIIQLEKPLMIQKMIKTLKEIKDNDLVVNNYSFESDLYAEVDSFPVYEYITKILESEKHGYVIDKGILTASDFGVPQKRKRFVVMGIKKSISNEVKLPENKTPRVNTVKDAIYDIEDCATIFSVAEDNGVTLPKIPKRELSELARKLRNNNKLFNNVITDTRETAMERFKLIKQGQNFHSLKYKYKKNTYTNFARTQNTIYLRLDYSKVSGTVVNVRKSMWIHPTKDRALSVREAARLQTFPDSFIFCGSKDSQYQQVGNAVPPMLAEAIANKLLNYLNNN